MQASISCGRTCCGMRTGRDLPRTGLSPLSLLLPPGCAAAEVGVPGGASWSTERLGKDQAALSLCTRHQRARACTAAAMSACECHIPSEATVCRRHSCDTGSKLPFPRVVTSAPGQRLNKDPR